MRGNEERKKICVSSGAVAECPDEAGGAESEATQLSRVWGGRQVQL